MEQLYIGVDLGGTNIAAGIVNKSGELLCKKSVRTNLPKPREQIEQDILKLCTALCEKGGYDLKKDILSVGIGTPGSVDGKTGKVGFNANFGYKDWRLKENLEGLFKLPIFVENDANAAIIAEAAVGSARGCSHAVILTLGTGIGAGVLIAGKVFAGSNYAGTELGHMVIDFGGRQCSCGRKGCFERYASATALTNDTIEAMENNKNSTLWEICPTLSKVTAKTAFDGAKLGDETAMAVVNQYIEYLACGVVNVINIFQPQVLCFGGGVSNEGEFLLNPLKAIVDREEYARNMPKRTKLVIAKFRNDAGIIGAALLGAANA
ncbi:MAG: ROK family protein [Oscillospiraceae bacterium]